jgi:hypothetical protein
MNSDLSIRTEKQAPSCIGKICSRSHYTLAILIRLWSFTFTVYTMVHTFLLFNNYYILTGSLFIFLMPIECYYSFKNNNFKENKYFSAHLFLFTFAILPCIWILHINRLGFKKNESKFSEMHSEEVNTFTSYTPGQDLLFFKIENTFMITLIMAQWLLPKNQTESEDVYSLVINTLSMSLDMHELFFTSFKEEILSDTKNNSGIAISLAILSAWSWSLILLTLNSDAKTKMSDKQQAFEATRKSIMSQKNYRVSYFKWDDQEYLPIIFENFYWKYIITISAMDGPFFMIRMIVMLKYNINDVKHTFFLFKNLIQIIIQLIRILGRIYFRMA